VPTVTFIARTVLESSSVHQ